MLGLINLPLFGDPTIVGGRCVDDHGHGTHVAGIAAITHDGRGDSGTLRNAVALASNSALIVAAAGNDGASLPSYQGSIREIASVAATDNRDQRAVLSTFNNDVEVAAPEVEIVSTWKDGGKRAASGTSTATPHAAGVAAVIAGTLSGSAPVAVASEARPRRRRRSRRRDPQTGLGRVNLQRAAME